MRKMENFIGSIRQEAMNTEIVYLEDKQAYRFLAELEGPSARPYKNGAELAKNILQSARTNGMMCVITHLELVCYLIAVGDAAKMYVSNDPEKLYHFVGHNPIHERSKSTLEALKHLVDLKASEVAVVPLNLTL